MNNMKITFDACSENESFARIAVAGFLMYLDPSLSDIEDIKMAVSEAVTNSIIHAYDNGGVIELKCSVKDRNVVIEIMDRGKGIVDIKKAMEPMYTSKPQCERSGLGFTVMESFMDRLIVNSAPGKGTVVTMYKELI